MIQEEGSTDTVPVEHEVRQMHAGIRERENIRGMFVPEGLRVQHMKFASQGQVKN